MRIQQPPQNYSFSFFEEKEKNGHNVLEVVTTQVLHP